MHMLIFSLADFILTSIICRKTFCCFDVCEIHTFVSSSTLQTFENVKSTENVSEPDFDISNSIDTAKELLFSKPQSSTTPDVKKSNESKLLSYEICFPDFYFSSVKNGWLCKICCSFSHGDAGNRAFFEKPGRRWIPNPGVPCSKPLGGSKVDSAFHPPEVDKMSTRNFWELSGKK